MPITIKEIFASDTISGAADKINYNFDQVILNGGGPAGPQGSQGVSGPAGPQGAGGSQGYQGAQGAQGSQGQAAGWAYAGSQGPSKFTSFDAEFAPPLNQLFTDSSGNYEIPAILIGAYPTGFPSYSGTENYIINDTYLNQISIEKGSLFIHSLNNISGVPNIVLSGGDSSNTTTTTDMLQLQLTVNDGLRIYQVKDSTSATDYGLQTYFTDKGMDLTAARTVYLGQTVSAPTNGDQGFGPEAVYITGYRRAYDTTAGGTIYIRGYESTNVLQGQIAVTPGDATYGIQLTTFASKSVYLNTALNTVINSSNISGAVYLSYNSTNHAIFGRLIKTFTGALNAQYTGPVPTNASAYAAYSFNSSGYIGLSGDFSLAAWATDSNNWAHFGQPGGTGNMTQITSSAVSVLGSNIELKKTVAGADPGAINWEHVDVTAAGDPDTERRQISVSDSASSVNRSGNSLLIKPGSAQTALVTGSGKGGNLYLASGQSRSQTSGGSQIGLGGSIYMLWDGTTSQATYNQRGDYYQSVYIGLRTKQNYSTTPNYRLLISAGQDTVVSGTQKQKIAAFYEAGISTPAVDIDENGLTTFYEGAAVDNGDLEIKAGNDVLVNSGDIIMGATGASNLTIEEGSLYLNDFSAIHDIKGDTRLGDTTWNGALKTIAGGLSFLPVATGASSNITDLGIFTAAASIVTFTIPKFAVYQKFKARINAGVGNFKPIQFNHTGTFTYARMFVIEIENDAASADDIRVKYGDAGGGRDCYVMASTGVELADITPGNKGIFMFFEVPAFGGSPGLMYIGGDVTNLS